jgi:hypothetical protein
MKKLFSFIMVGLAFTVLQVSISQAQVTAPGGDSEVERADMTQGGVAGEDKGGQGRIRNKMTHGAKQGRSVPGTQTSGNFVDEESKAGEHQSGHEKRITTERGKKKSAAGKEAKRKELEKWKRAQHEKCMFDNGKRKLEGKVELPC